MLLDENNYAEMKILPSLEENLKNIRNIMGKSMDLQINEVTVTGHKCALICCEGMLSTRTITQLVLHPLFELTLPEGSTPDELKEHIDGKMLLSTDRPKPTDYGEMIRLFMSGFAILLIDGAEGALAFGVQGYDKRGISEPSGENNLKGSHEGFTEVIRTNISLIRRRMKTPTVRFDMSQLGSKSDTDICLVYMTDRVSKKMLHEVIKRLGKIELETILTSGYVQPFLEGKSTELFQSVGTTERPDVLCSKILEGRIGLLIDGTPFALIIPYLFVENFQTVDDYASKPYYATFLRWIRYIAFFVSVLLPGAYVGIALYHPEFLNGRLLLSLASEEAGAPLPLAAEAFIMLILYELIREAGLRLPKGVGGTVGIVGGLIIGDTAVSSGLVSTPLLLAVALSVTASFVIPSLNESTTALRLVFLAAGALGGLYGIALALAAAMSNLNAADNYGIPETAPVSPFSASAMGDVAIRLPFPKMQSRNFDINKLRNK